MLKEIIKVASKAAKIAGKSKATKTLESIGEVAKHLPKPKNKKCTKKAEAQGKCKRR